MSCDALVLRGRLVCLQCALVSSEVKQLAVFSCIKKGCIGYKLIEILFLSRASDTWKMSAAFRFAFQKAYSSLKPSQVDESPLREIPSNISAVVTFSPCTPNVHNLSVQIETLESA